MGAAAEIQRATLASRVNACASATVMSPGLPMYSGFEPWWTRCAAGVTKNHLTTGSRRTRRVWQSWPIVIGE